MFVMISYSWVWNLCIFTIYSVITRSLGECRLPVKTLQLEQMAVMGQAEEPSVVASRMRLVFSTLEVSFLVCVLRNRLLSYLYFVNLNQERIWFLSLHAYVCCHFLDYELIRYIVYIYLFCLLFIFNKISKKVLYRFWVHFVINIQTLHFYLK